MSQGVETALYAVRSLTANAPAERLRVTVRGAVQGVGFRPCVYRLATELGLRGWVLNSAQGVFIEVEGSRPRLEEFLLRLEKDKPPRAIIHSLEFSFLDPVGYAGFEIRHSEDLGQKTVLVLPDIATCPACLAEVFDARDRRFRYPFTNCTNCGPRFTIIEALPYDRPLTSMKDFALCSACAREYTDPLDRRFHAQPNACPVCGPHLALYDRLPTADGRPPTSKDSAAVGGPWSAVAEGDEALRRAAEAIRAGQIVAVKGLGGFLLVADARREETVQTLRHRKQREEKPFALMYPSLEAVQAHCYVSALEARLLLAPESPIVLLQRPTSPLTPRGDEDEVAPSVAPGNPYLGVMLPYTPLHHLLMRELGFPVVATSGNLADEPIVTDEQEALVRLSDLADLFLVHNRPIVRHMDDSVVRIVRGQELVLRRARGYAPLPVQVKEPALSGTKSRLPPILAVGAHRKNSVAIAVEDQVFLSQHIGDLDTPEAYQAFLRVIADLQKLYAFRPEWVACDLHPDYLSTQYARRLGLPVIGVQHHHAHLAACLAENQVEGPVLGVTWDGTGYGLDGTVWGGEFLWGDAKSFERVAHLRSFRLPGGEQAIKEPRRAALGVLWALFADKETRGQGDKGIVFFSSAFRPNELKVLRQMLAKGVNAPLTSSAGRLFDAVAALIGLRYRASFEGQAAMELEYAIDEIESGAYPFEVTGRRGDSALLVIDWEPLVLAVLDDVQNGAARGIIAARFHNTLAESIVSVAKQVGEKRVALTGGCFQNRYLTERACRRLEEEGFRPYVHQRVPPNDGGIALGQVMVAAAIIRQHSDENRPEGFLATLRV